ncbi:MAG TPA: methyltransferase [Ilumatobacteraceae bacterium]|nr:methyltransferase [Ilumatobacteraceae bacterium]
MASETTVVDVALPDVAFTMTTDRGVFSHGHLDTGTSLLLREAPAPAATGDVLDLGCGSGAIALTMALRSPEARVWAVDVNARAVELTAANASRNGVTIHTAVPDDVPEDVRFSTIWSNPPIRIGKPQLQRLLLRWLSRLTPDGAAVLVVQKHLGADSLQRWLGEQRFDVERIASRAGFRLLRVRDRSA